MNGQIGEFIARVIKTLQDNGYPENRVSLPLEKMYEQAEKNGTSFNKVLDFLKEKEGIDHEKTTQKIIFFPVQEEEQQAEPLGGFDPSAIADMMSGLDPEKMKNMSFGGMMMEAARMLKNMSPDQIAKIKSMVENLSDEERQELMKKAKKMGFPS